MRQMLLLMLSLLIFDRNFMFLRACMKSNIQGKLFYNNREIG